MGEGAQQALVVALVQAYGGFIQDIHHAHQAGANLGGQADALGLAAGQGLGAAVQGQVIQAHIHQEAVPGAQLLEDLVGDLALASFQLQLLEVQLRLAHRHAGDGRQVALVHEHVAGVPPQAGALAVGAGMGGEEPGQLLAHRLGVGVAIAALHVGDDALEGVGALDHVAAIVDVGEGHLLLATAVQDGLLVLPRQRLEGGIDVEAEVLGQRVEHMEIVDIAPVPAAYGALGEAGLGVQHDALRVEILLHAQPVAAAAGTGGVVEGKQAGFQFVNAVATLRAGEARREADVLAVAIHVADGGQAVGEGQGGLEGFRQANAQVISHLEAVHHHLDAVFPVFLQGGGVVQVGDDAVDAGAHEAAGAQFLEDMQVLALALAHDRRQQHQLAALGQGQHGVHHLADGLGLQVVAVVGAARFAHAGKQQAQVVVDLGDGAHGGARVVGGGLLLDGDGRGQSLDVVHIGLFHHRQELPGIGGQGFHVAPLALGVEGIESQG